MIASKMNLHLLFLVSTALPGIFAFELITGTAFLIGATLSYLYGKEPLLKVLDLAACSTGVSIYECCGKPSIDPRIADLRVDLRNSVFGQPIVQEMIPAAIESSIDEHSPSKPLVLSFHGPTGVGKNYVASFIARNYFLSGGSSKFYHSIESRVVFPRQAEYLTYQEQLRSWIRGNVTECPYSMFVFNEVDKMPTKVLDGIIPFLDHHEILNGVDYRRAIFIFISNIGQEIIMERYLELWRREGKRREDMTINDFDKVINRAAFNEQGGFQMSDIIDHNLIDFYVPFLPLEKIHLKMCMQSTMRQKKVHIDDSIMEEIMKIMTFGPEPEMLFAHSGCKRIDSQLRTHIIKKKYRSSFEV